MKMRTGRGKLRWNWKRMEKRIKRIGEDKRRKIRRH